MAMATTAAGHAPSATTMASQAASPIGRVVASMVPTSDVARPTSKASKAVSPAMRGRVSVRAFNGRAGLVCPMVSDATLVGARHVVLGGRINASPKSPRPKPSRAIVSRLETVGRSAA